MRRAIAAYDKLIDALGVLPGIIIGATALAIGTDVVLRDIGFGGIYGMIEIIEYAILLLAMAGVGHVTRLGRHVTVDIATDLLPARWAWRMQKIRLVSGHAQFVGDDVALEDVAVGKDFRADAPGFAVASQITAGAEPEVGRVTPCAPSDDMDTLVGKSGGQRTARPIKVSEVNLSFVP